MVALNAARGGGGAVDKMSQGQKGTSDKFATTGGARDKASTGSSTETLNKAKYLR